MKSTITASQPPRFIQSPLIKSLSLLAISFMLIGCADPITKLLRSNGNYALIRPATDGLHLGDVHNTPNLQNSSIPMDRVLQKSELKSLMAQNVRNVVLPTNSGTSSYTLGANVGYTGVAQGQLELRGAKKFSVTAYNPVVYDAPFDAVIIPEILPAIQRKYPNVDLTGKYIVRSLLLVQGLEYEFYDSKGGKIDIAADKNLVDNLTANGNVAWEVTRNSKLAITTPMYIGYRLAKVGRDGKIKGPGFWAMASAPSDPSAAPYSLKALRPSEYQPSQEQ